MFKKKEINKLITIIIRGIFQMNNLNSVMFKIQSVEFNR